MASQSEVGHARNVANLRKLIQQITAYTLYNPPVPNNIDHIPWTHKKNHRLIGGFIIINL